LIQIETLLIVVESANLCGTIWDMRTLLKSAKIWQYAAIELICLWSTARHQCLLCTV